MGFLALQNGTTIGARLSANTMAPASRGTSPLNAGPQPGWQPGAPTVVQGLGPPPPPPVYTEQGPSYQAQPALQVANYTGSSLGGTPGAQFGPPGVGGAPVSLTGGLSPLELLVGLGVVGFIAWRLLR